MNYFPQQHWKDLFSSYFSTTTCLLSETINRLSRGNSSKQGSTHCYDSHSNAFCTNDRKTFLSLHCTWSIFLCKWSAFCLTNHLPCPFLSTAWRTYSIRTGFSNITYMISIMRCRTYSFKMFSSSMAAELISAASPSRMAATFEICSSASFHCFCSIASRTAGIVFTP